MPAVVTTKPRVVTEPPLVADRSGLTPIDWLLMAADNEWRTAHDAAEDAAACDRKLARLDALLDDPELARTHPEGDPERTAAITRHVALTIERNRHRADFRRAAKGTAEAWEKLPARVRGYFVVGVVRGWGDSPAFGLALTDAGLNRLAFWPAVLREWQAPTQEERPCPF
jgi:hypothetical protein